MMARLKEPEMDQLPPGPRRTIVTALHEAHRAAGSPSFRSIEAAIVDDDSYADTASRQTISLMFRGVEMPRWSKVDCIVRQLAKMSIPRRDPDQQAERFLELWNALGAPPSPIVEMDGERPAEVKASQQHARTSGDSAKDGPAGRYADGTQRLPDGGLAQVDEAVAALQHGEYRRGWAAGLQLVAERPDSSLLADLALDDFDVERWVPRQRSVSPRQDQNMSDHWSTVLHHLQIEPINGGDYALPQSPRYLAGFGDALRAAWARAGGKLPNVRVPVAGDAAAAARALHLLEQQFAELAAAATPSSMKYKPDEEAYQDRKQELAPLLDRLGITSPYPWSTVAVAVAALKSQFTGGGAYARRRSHLREQFEPVAEQLRTLSAR